MEQEKSETKRLAEMDTAIEIMAAMRATRITRIAMEELKPENLRDDKMIERLKKELDMLREERHLMYCGNQEVQDKILNQYSKEMKEYFAEQKDNVR